MFESLSRTATESIKAPHELSLYGAPPVLPAGDFAVSVARYAARAIQPIQRRWQTAAMEKDNEHICESEAKATIVIDNNELSAPVLIAKR
jgi:hypothetical protein